MALSTTCHCGAITIVVPRRPRSVTNCSCSVCRRYGTLWGYYKAGQVRIMGEPDASSGYTRGARTIRFVRCATCGCVTHWEPLVAERGDRMGVNMRNFHPDQLGPVRIRRLDGDVTERYL